MSYRLESFIEKIKSPVVCVFGDKETEYANGTVLAEQSFEKYWLVESITVRDNKVVLTMKENSRVNSIEWIGEDGVDKSFF